MYSFVESLRARMPGIEMETGCKFIFDHATLKNYISAVIYSSISSYTSLERAKIKLLEGNP